MAAVDLQSHRHVVARKMLESNGKQSKHLDERKSIIMSNRFQRLRYETFPINTDDDTMISWAKRSLEKDGQPSDVNLTVYRDPRVYRDELSAHDQLVLITRDPGIINVARFRDDSPLDQPPSKEEVELADEIYAQHGTIVELNKTWWANPEHWEDGQEFIECPNCLSNLRLKWCGDGGRKAGHSYGNYCPVCDSDLRPSRILDKLKALNELYRENEQKYKDLKDSSHSRLLAVMVTIDQNESIG